MTPAAPFPQNESQDVCACMLVSLIPGEEQKQVKQIPEGLPCSREAREVCEQNALMNLLGGGRAEQLRCLANISIMDAQIGGVEEKESPVFYHFSFPLFFSD